MMTTMGLNVVVGIRNQISMDDPDDEAVNEFVADVNSVRQALVDCRLPDWEEPNIDDADGADFELFDYAGVHSLRRVAAHLQAHGQVPQPDEDDEHAVEDETLQALYDRGPTYWVEPTPGGQPVVHGHAHEAAESYDHLIHHSDADGCYVPVDFAPVVIDERAYGGYIGSSHRLLDECLRLAVALQIPVDLDLDSDEVWDAADGTLEGAKGWQRYGVETYTCLRLIDAARRSIATGAAIFFV
jgi:hypothetical protein